MKSLILATLIALTAIPASAGGPVIIEDTAEAAAPRDRNVIPLIIIGALIVGGLLAGGGTCYQDETPEPTPPSGEC